MNRSAANVQNALRAANVYRRNVLPIRFPRRILRRLHTVSRRSQPTHPPQSNPKPENTHPDPHTPPHAPPPPPPPLRRRLIDAWKNTPTKWYPLPLSIGILLLGALQWRKRNERQEQEEADAAQPPVRLQGPWQVHILGALPLRNLSRLWGYVNSLELPVWFRPIGFKVYAYIFGCNLEELDPEDLAYYKSLGEFFYRKLKDGVRPIADALLVSPADGKVLHFGTITHANTIEQVKGLTYSLDALLGSPTSSLPSLEVKFAERDPHHALVDDREFANVNGIEYSLDRLIGRQEGQRSVDEGGPEPASDPSTLLDASVPSQSSPSDSISVAREMGMGAPVSPSPLTRTTSISSLKEGHQLYFVVIYLAPGDYHRFHSPTAWVVEKRRHFAGELFSVSPYMAKRLANLFVLNERVALLGRWKFGFFGMVPVGATNVGSIRVNFDESLRTNLRPRPSPGTFTEAIYAAASPLLRGQPLHPGQEMGGFRLGSTVVLVFEAPSNFQFDVEIGKKVKVGQKLGDLVR